MTEQKTNQIRVRVLFFGGAKDTVGTNSLGLSLDSPATLATASATLLDKFPELKVLVLESGGGWIGYWLDRIDAVYGHTFIGDRVPLEHKPSDYFRERIWISCDPDERMIPALAERYGVERFLWASDFPHADHTPEYIHDLNELVGMFRPDDQAKFIGGNARALFKL